MSAIASPSPELPVRVDRDPGSLRSTRCWSIARSAQTGAGVVALAFGLAVVVAWLAGNDDLTRVHPLFPPMPYSVAIGLAVGGVALLAGATGGTRLAGATASVVLALGLATLAQPVVAPDWNPHRALLAGLIEGVPPGMTPSTALSFGLIGIGLLAVSVQPRRGNLVCAIAGTAVAAQNAAAFGWYSFGPGSPIVNTGSPPHVAIGLTVLGIGAIAAAQSPDGPPRWLPVPVALGVALVTLLWHQSESDRIATVREMARLRAERIGGELHRQTAPLADALQRVAEAEAARRSGRPTIDPQLLSALDLQRLPGVFAIALVDRQSGLAWMQTKSPASPSLADLQAPEQAASLLLQRPLRGSPSLVDRHALPAGGSGFVIAVPIRGSAFIGFVVGLLRYDEFFSAALAEDLATDYWLRVFGGQRELYRHAGAPSSSNPYTAAVMIPLFDALWRAEIRPRVVRGPRKPLAEWTLVFGLAFAGLLGWTVQLAQRSARSRNLLSHARADLSSAILAQQAAQAAHDESEVRYRRIIDAAADIIYRTDIKGRFLFVNPAAIRVTKWSREDLIGRQYLSLIKPDCREDVRAFYQRQAVERVPSTYYEFPIITADGQEVWIGQHVQLLVDGVLVVGFQAVAHDISQRIRLHDNLQRTRDAALETARLKSAFVANTSQEIRSPLNGIIGYCSLLLDTDLSPEQRTCAEGLRVSADALRAIVDDVLDFSTIEAGMLRLEVVDFDLRTLVNDVGLAFGEAARRKRLALDVQVAENLPARIAGDPRRLRQVLNNLLANAIKFTEQGSVRVGVELAEPAVVRFSVADTGIGIEPDAQRRLFQPFVQADPSTSRRFGGTGLGLAICREVVGLMGGSITVASSPGSGSVFSFTIKCDGDLQGFGAHRTHCLHELPDDELHGIHDGIARTDRSESVGLADPAPSETLLIRASGASASDEAHFVFAHVTPPRSEGWSVLVVDDNPVSRTVTKLSVEKLGFTVETASNGLEAVRAVSSAPFSLVLMDCQMPVMDGYTAAAIIRRNERGRFRIPIVAFTASARPGEREQCLAAGMDDLLEKPYKTQELARVLERWTKETVQPTPTISEHTAGPCCTIVDVAVSDSLRRHVGHDTLNRMIELHLNDVDDAIRRMQLLTECDATSLKSEAHRLKGSSRMLGFSELGALCGMLEEQVDRLTTSERSKHLWRLRAAYVALREWQVSNT